MMIYATIVAALGVIVAIAHSVIGERLLIRPLYAERTDGILADKSTRDIIRAVMHMPSLAWAGLAIAVLINRWQDGTDLMPITAAIIFVISGVGNLLALKRPHPGGLILVAMAVLSLADILTN
ncbi:MAG: hypothetical protein ABJN65_14255 [Parasphingorhabdus sp.]